MTRLAWVIVIAACSKSSRDQPVPTAAPEKKFDIKPIDNPHEPKPEELGPAVDAKTGFAALCAAIPDDGKQRGANEIMAYVRGALFQYPNSDVIRFMGVQGNLPPGEQRLRFRAQLDAHGIQSCRLLDLRSRESNPP